MSTGPLHLDGFESATVTNKKEEALASSFLLVPVTGLEPVRHRWRRILSPLRLPFHHTGRCVILLLHAPIRFASAGVRLRCPKFPARCSLAKFRPLPIAQVAPPATGGAPFAPQTLIGPPSLAADFESATSTFFSHRQVCSFSCLYSIVQFPGNCKKKEGHSPSFYFAVFSMM